MTFTGHCYCGQLRYEAGGDAVFKGQCHCRECQYVTGGMPALVMGVPAAQFRYTQGTPKGFTRRDIPNPVTREFCAECGTHVATRSPAMKEVVMLKVGSLDDPKLFGQPQMVIFSCDKQPFHQIPDSVPIFERTPG
jgi:hypothetical protein